RIDRHEDTAGIPGRSLHRLRCRKEGLHRALARSVWRGRSTRRRGRPPRRGAARASLSLCRRRIPRHLHARSEKRFLDVVAGTARQDRQMVRLRELQSFAEVTRWVALSVGNDLTDLILEEKNASVP